MLDKPNGWEYYVCMVTKAEVAKVMSALGKKTSPAKAAAARRNAKLGGRPRKRNMDKQTAAAIASGLNSERVRVICHYPKCRLISAPVSNYCKKHGAIVKRQYEKSTEKVARVAS